MINDEHISFFKKNGYLIVDNIISSKELEQARSALKNMIFFIINRVQKKFPEYKFTNINRDNVLSKGIDILESIDHVYISEFYDSLSMNNNPYAAKILSGDKILSSVNRLLDKDADTPLFVTSSGILFAYQSDDLYTANKWHTDIFYTFPDSEYVHFWAPLVEDSTEELGAIHVMPGSHKNHFESEVRDDSRKDSSIYRYTVSDSLLGKYEDKTLELRLGQGLFFDKHLVHRAGNNVSNRSRFGVIGFYHAMCNDKFTPYEFSHSKSTITADEYFDQVIFKDQ